MIKKCLFLSSLAAGITVKFEMMLCLFVKLCPLPFQIPSNIEKANVRERDFISHTIWSVIMVRVNLEIMKVDV